MKLLKLGGLALGIPLAIAAGILWCMAAPVLSFAVVELEGSRAGQVVKISQRGTFWKTWEGELAETQNGAVVQKWSFSVDSADARAEALVKVLRAAADSGWQVRLGYEERLGVPWPWRAETCALVQEVEFLRPRPWPPAVPLNDRAGR